jgi:hypothetical protein
MPRIPLYSLVLFCAVSTGISLGQTKKTVNTAADLPRFSYPLTQPASSLLKADDATLNVLANKVEADVNSVLADYNISDKEGGLNWSMQHWLGVYSPGFQSPRSFAGVDLGAELPY